MQTSSNQSNPKPSQQKWQPYQGAKWRSMTKGQRRQHRDNKRKGYL